MIQINIYVPPEMLADLRAEKEKTGAGVSEIVRRAIAVYISEAKK